MTIKRNKNNTPVFDKLNTPNQNVENIISNSDLKIESIILEDAKKAGDISDAKIKVAILGSWTNVTRALMLIENLQFLSFVQGVFIDSSFNNSSSSNSSESSGSNNASATSVSWKMNLEIVAKVVN